MVKGVVLFFLMIAASVAAKAQTADTLFNRLGDFDLARFYNNTASALALGEKILPDTAKLTPKVRISFFNRMAKLYEDTKQDTKAIFYYEKVAAAVPDYFVAQRALGYLYYEDAKQIHLELYNVKKGDPGYDQLFTSYQSAVRKALPHLEKAQACDPSDETLDLIRSLYQNIHDDQGLNSLNTRLKGLSKNCIDLLSDH